MSRMLELSPILIAGLTGFISGLLLSIPVGPVNLTIMNEGARRGFFWALLISAGASVMEVIYCTIAFTGFAPNVFVLTSAPPSDELWAQFTASSRDSPPISPFKNRIQRRT